MANNKDFVVETGIEVSGTFNFSQGVVSSGTVDLSTGSYFKDTLSANTTYVFSNSPQSLHIFHLEVTGASDALYTITWPSSVTWSFGATPNTPSPNGTIRYYFITSDGGTSYTGGVVYE